MGIIQNFRSLPVKSKRLLGVGLVFALVIALPLFVWGVSNTNLNIAERAQDVQPTPGNPNYCGGTCGSNFNCQANYFCFNGFCRNPLCPGDSDCICFEPSSPPSPSAVSKTPKPTPEIIYYAAPASSPAAKVSTQSPKATPSPEASPAPGKNTSMDSNWIYWGLYAFLGFSFIYSFFALIKTIKKPRSPNAF